MGGTTAGDPVSWSLLQHDHFSWVQRHILEAPPFVLRPSDNEKGEAALTRPLSGRCIGSHLRGKGGFVAPTGTLAAHLRPLVARPESVDGSLLHTRSAATKHELFWTLRHSACDAQRLTTPNSESELGLAGLHVDAVWGRSRRHYVTFVRDLRKSKSLCFTTNPAEMAGVFFVQRKEWTFANDTGCEAWESKVPCSAVHVSPDGGRSQSRRDDLEKDLTWLVAAGDITKRLPSQEDSQMAGQILLSAPCCCL